MSLVLVLVLQQIPLAWKRDEVALRHFVEAALGICRAGAPWRDLPKGLGCWSSVSHCWRRWCLHPQPAHHKVQPQSLGHYTLAFVHSLIDDAAVAVAASDHSQRLSPFDPLLFGILGSRAMALLRLGWSEDVAEVAVKAAVRPNVHAISWRSLPSLARSSGATRKRVPTSPQSGRHCRATVRTISSLPCSRSLRARSCSATVANASALGEAA
ncbi:transposase [Belnapia sp. T18]|uniref:Transposase n=1 Tax=Belnapia arida TaxID=2804533 RepID=A0ABS1UCQ8_9PROT|nr:transposase [Belnapia arida]